MLESPDATLQFSACNFVSSKRLTVEKMMFLNLNFIKEI